MKFSSRAAVLTFLMSLALVSTAAAQTTKKTYSAPVPAPKPAPAAPRQSPAPARSAPARQSSAPSRSTSSTPRQYSGSQRQTSSASRQTRSHTRSSPSQSASGSNSQSAPQSQTTQPQTRQERAAQAKQQYQQRRDQARQARQQRQQQQQQRKEQIRQAKEQQRQQRQKEKEQARQAKEQQKQERQKQKELARQQKGQKPVPNPTSAGQNSAPKTAANPASAHPAAAPVYSAPPSSAIASRTSTGATLNRSASQSVVQQVNSSRANMTGINQRPLPAGDVTVHQNGRLTISAAGGRQYGVRPNGTVSSYRDSSKAVTFDGNGRVSSLHTADMDIQRSATGQQMITSHLPNNTTVVSTGPHSGYVEHNVVIGNQTYVQRTIVVNSQVTTRMYVGYPYGGIVLNRYVAPVYFAPGFYGWTYDAWGNPVPYYGWGWMGDPWYMGPNPYFAAYPVYPGAAFWLTDYMLGQTLAAAYQSQADAALDSNAPDYSADASGSSGGDSAQSDELEANVNTAITPEIKNQIAAEVKDEVGDDKAASTASAQQASGDELASALSRQNYIFVVASNLDVTTSDEQNCGLQPGDTLQNAYPSGSGAIVVELRVASSKRQSCPAGVMVSVSVQDLQEMLNSFHAQVESGLVTLQAKQGQGGLPAAPADALAAPRQAVPDSAPVAGSEVTATLDTQRQQAKQTEAQAADAAFAQ